MEQKVCSRKRFESDKGSESFNEEVKKLEIRPMDTNPKESGFNSLRRKLKQKVEERKGFESPHKGSESFIWEYEEHAMNTWKIQILEKMIRIHFKRQSF